MKYIFPLLWHQQVCRILSRAARRPPGSEHTPFSTPGTRDTAAGSRLPRVGAHLPTLRCRQWVRLPVAVLMLAASFFLWDELLKSLHRHRQAFEVESAAVHSMHWRGAAHTCTLVA